ncbi:MAG: hypothetical protein ACI81L_002432 [Verrucomicrobiales bacterium]|jgi:uncharacterized protein (DUF885 family)
MADIFELSDRATDLVAAADPVLATYQGISGHDHQWPDYSPAGHRSTRDLYAELREATLACPIPDDRHMLAQRVLLEHCDMSIRLHDSGGHQVSLNNIESPHQDLRFIYGSMGDETDEEWEAIIARVASAGEALESYRQTLEEGRRASNVVSRRQVEAVIGQGTSAAGNESSFHALREKLAEAPVDNATFSGRLDAAIDSAKTAFGTFNDYLREEYLSSAAEADGVGEERYVQSAELFLGTQLDARGTYRWGWDEVERLWEEMRIACAQIDPDSPAEQVLHDLNTKPEYAATDIDDFIAVMKERQVQALANLDGLHFDVPPEIRTIDVQVAPAGGSLAAYYVGPSEDFSRPGSVWYPVEGREHFPLFGEITTAYHEGFPGHHLQVGVQCALRDQLSRFHRSVVWYSGSGEGWALYAEHLMGELGYFERPEYLVGLLASQLLRSARIAIDIGVHLDLPIPNDVSFHPGERWTFELAHEMLTSRAFVSHDESTSEVLRYFGWPGQAISYKVGEKAILDLRDDWKTGTSFDPKLFHSTVLGVGSVGLDLLEDRVRALKPR